MRKALISFFVGLILLPLSAAAHAFGQKYTLPLPVWLYVFGGGAAIIISFLLIAYFTSKADGKSLETFVDLSKWKFFSGLTKSWLAIVLKFLGIIVFILFIAAGITQAPINYAVPTIFWIVFLLGFTYFVALIGNLWPAVNPFKTMVFWADKHGPLVPYPKKLGYWPALFFSVMLIWLELLSGGAGVRPEQLIKYALFYTVITLVGALLFGSKDWFRYADFFSVFFRLLGKIAPFTHHDGRLYLRWPIMGLLKSRAENLSLLCFVIFMLSSTAFDGFRETVRAKQIYIFLSPFAKTYQNQQIIMLIGISLLFLGAYLGAVWAMKLFAKSQVSVRELALLFAFSLIPIALVYNLAHYFTLLLVQGQGIIPILSDPLGLGWNLFGAGDYEINVGILGAKTIWQMQVFFILAGHIAAVYLSHIVALRTFDSRKLANISQLPMLLVMVAYTMAGLWILSQPLTIGG